MNRSLVRSLLASIAAFALALLVAIPAMAQAGTVSGSVTDAVTGRPLVGAQVSIPDARLGGLANASGNYLILRVPPGTHTVRVDMIGYGFAEQEITVADGQTAVADFQMRQSAISLDELVVTGTAQRTQKRAIGNAVSSVKAEQITELAPVQDVQELLAARSPGLTIMSNAGNAGASSKIRIRGAGTINGNVEPVIYVDGIRINGGTQDTRDAAWGGAQATSGLDAINPDDIESIEVIKGPSATTLYGADAAAGVIQIITKKGRSSQGIQWTASVEAGQTDWAAERPTNYWLCTDSEVGSESWPGCNRDGATIGTLLTDDPVGRPEAGAIRKGDIWDVNLSARGGGSAFNYFLSFQRGDEQGVFHNNYARRSSGRANFGFTPTEKLSANVNVAYVREGLRVPLGNNASNGILRNGFRGRPGFFGSNSWAEGFRGFSPELSNQYDNTIQNERTTIGMTLNFSPLDFWENRLTLGLDKTDAIHQEFYRIDETGRAPWGATNATGVVGRDIPETHVWTLDYAGTVNNELTEDYNSSFSAGLQLNARRFERHSVSGEGLIANSLNLVGAAAVTNADQFFEEQTSLGFFVQEQIGYKDRLYGTVAVRVDDNSAFGEDFSLVVYPKASLSYVISDEDFFDVGFIDDLKLRAAWGQAGNAPEPFSADRTFEPANTTVGEVPVNQLQPDEFGNPDLKAETGQELELGFDASLFEGRAGMEATYYYQQTKDALIAVPSPRSLGFSGNFFTNIGEIRNSGFELLLNVTPILSRNLQWDATVALGTNSNELVSFGGVRNEITFGSFASVQRHREGFPLGGFWSVDVERDGSGAPILDSNGNATPLTACRWEPSDPTWTASECAETYEGPMLPTREIGFTNTFTLFGNVRIFSHLDYKGGHKQWCAMCSIRNRIDRNTFEVNSPTISEAERAVWLSRQTATHIKDADFIKLRELSLTLDVPGEYAQRLRADRLSFTVSGRNLWTWTKYFDGFDPEVSFWSQSDFTQLDYASLPTMRRWTVSTRVTF